jgi:alkylhydroperoxidase/carboxymuconolactone decarboxylase family protein YurZ
MTTGESSGEGDARTSPDGNDSIWRIAIRSEHLQLLRRLTLSDEAALNDIMAGRLPAEETLLDGRTRSLVRLAGLIALDAETSSLQAAIESAFAAGANEGEIVEVALAVAPTVGSARLTSVLPRLRVALERD